MQEQQLIDDFAQSAVVWFAAGALAFTVANFVAFFFLWGFVSDAVLGLLTGPPPPDPFANM